jgi:predicted nucleic acid-binding protein
VRFVDASVFLHAYLKPKRTLKPHEKEIRENAKSILRRISEGERVLTTTVHFGEVANLLEDLLPLPEALELESGILALDNVEMVEVSRGMYLAVNSLAVEKGVGLNDALAVVAMRKGEYQKSIPLTGISTGWV